MITAPHVLLWIALAVVGFMGLTLILFAPLAPADLGAVLLGTAILSGIFSWAIWGPCAPDQDNSVRYYVVDMTGQDQVELAREADSDELITRVYIGDGPYQSADRITPLTIRTKHHNDKQAEADGLITELSFRDRVYGTYLEAERAIALADGQAWFEKGNTVVPIPTPTISDPCYQEILQ